MFVRKGPGLCSFLNLAWKGRQVSLSFNVGLFGHPLMGWLFCPSHCVTLLKDALERVRKYSLHTPIRLVSRFHMRESVLEVT